MTSQKEVVRIKSKKQSANQQNLGNSSKKHSASQQNLSNLSKKHTASQLSLSNLSQFGESSDDDEIDSNFKTPAHKFQFAPVEECRTVLLTLFKDLAAELDTESFNKIKKSLKKIAAHLTRISDYSIEEHLAKEQKIDHIQQLDKQIQQMEKQLEHYQNNIEKLMNKIPEPEAYAEAIETMVKTNCEQLQKQQIEQPQAPTQTVEQDTPVSRPIPNQHLKGLDAPPARRTIQISSRKEEPGYIIDEKLRKFKGLIPAGVIQDVFVGRKKVDILCRSITEKDKLKAELHRNRELMTTCNIDSKPEKHERIILLGAPTDTTDLEILKGLQETFDLPANQLKALFSLKTRQGYLNWVLAAPLDVTARLVDAGRVFL